MIKRFEGGSRARQTKCLLIVRSVTYWATAIKETQKIPATCCVFFFQLEGGSRARQTMIKKLKKQIMALVAAEKWDDALICERQLMDQFHEGSLKKICFCFCFCFCFWFNIFLISLLPEPRYCTNKGGNYKCHVSVQSFAFSHQHPCTLSPKSGHVKVPDCPMLQYCTKSIKLFVSEHTLFFHSEISEPCENLPSRV